MYISKISIRNFRVFDGKGITATFKKGVNNDSPILQQVKDLYSEAEWNQATDSDFEIMQNGLGYNNLLFLVCDGIPQVIRDFPVAERGHKHNAGTFGLGNKSGESDGFDARHIPDPRRPGMQKK